MILFILLYVHKKRLCFLNYTFQIIPLLEAVLLSEGIREVTAAAPRISRRRDLDDTCHLYREAAKCNSKLGSA